MRTNLNLLSSILLCCFFLLTQTLAGQLIINTTEVVDPQSDELLVTFEAQHFEQVVGLQFSIRWETENLEFLGIEYLHAGILNFNEDSFYQGRIEEGILPFLWIALEGLPPNVQQSDLFVLRFRRLSTANSKIWFSNLPTPIEVILLNETVELGTLHSFTNPITDQEQLIQGKVFWDQNTDCSFDLDEFPLTDWIIRAAGISQQQTQTQTDGAFSFLLPPGEHTITATPADSLWSNCEQSITFDVLETIDPNLTPIHIPAQVQNTCPILDLSLSSSALEACAENTYYLDYSNRGTATAVAAYVEVDLDPFLVLQTTSVPTQIIAPNRYRFDLGDIAVGTGGALTFTALLDCASAITGQTHCTEARIFPNPTCFVAPPQWSQAELALDASCQGDSVQFRIQNTGTGDMDDNQFFSIVEDMIIMYNIDRNLQLEAGEIRTINLPANGNTYHLQIPQVPNHPYPDQLGIFVEGCGTNDEGDFSRGIATMRPIAAESRNYAIDCQESLPDLLADQQLSFPKGAGDDHIIEPNTPIEYLIRFKNERFDTVFNLVVIDTLPTTLDAKSITPLIASHDYTFELIDDRVAKFTFPNIKLLSDGTGFIRFHVEQQANLPNGTQIQNTSHVQYNLSPILQTNVSQHQIGEPYQEVISSIEQLMSERVGISPNPFRSSTMLTIQNPDNKRIQFQLYDAFGKQINAQYFTGEQFTFERQDLSNGLYFFRLQTNGITLDHGHLIVQND